MTRTILMTMVVGWTLACSPAADRSPKADEQADNLYTLSREQMDMARIRTGPAERRLFSRVISCSGTIEAPPQNIIQVHAPVTAFVGAVAFKPGHRVRKGARLLNLRHPELIRLQRSFLVASAELQAAESRRNRTAKLAETEAASTQSLEQANAELRIARARYQGLKAELEFLGLPVSPLEQHGTIQDHLPLYAPANAIVDEVAINTGQLVQPEDLLYRLVDLRHLHLELRVFAADLSSIRIGQRIEASLPGTGDTLWGEVYLIGPSVDPVSGTAVIHGHFTSEPKVAVPGTYLQANILAEEQSYWAVPEEAVLREGDQYFLFILENGKVRKIETAKGPAYNGWVALPDWDPDAYRGDLVLEGAYYLRGLADG